jgi:hypothetical protein
MSEEASGRRFTEWHVLTIQEQMFARTHAQWVARALGIEGKLKPEIQAALEEETVNLLFVHRGSSIAAWLMEHASRCGNVPGFSGQPEDLKPGSSEALHLRLAAQDRASVGRPGIEQVTPPPNSESERG